MLTLPLSTIPAPGVTVLYEGQAYTVLGKEHYFQPHGRAVFSLAMQGECFHCGAPFVARVGLTEAGGTNPERTPTRRCKDCRRKEPRMKRANRVPDLYAFPDPSPARIATALSLLSELAPSGERYSSRRNDRTRYAGAAFVTMFGITREEADHLLSWLLVNKRIEVRRYPSTVQRKPRQGLFVVEADVFS